MTTKSDQRFALRRFLDFFLEALREAISSRSINSSPNLCRVNAVLSVARVSGSKRSRRSLILCKMR
jgi:hypothetical protein